MNRLVSFALLAAITGFAAASAQAQVQSKEQTKCLIKQFKTASKVLQTQTKDVEACIKDQGKDKLTTTVYKCAIADRKGKVAKSQAKALLTEEKTCAASPPDFGIADASSTNEFVLPAAMATTRSIFGASLLSMFNCDFGTAECKCQQATTRAADKVIRTALKQYLKCKSVALAAGATTDAALVACVEDAGTVESLTADTKGKVAKQVANLGKLFESPKGKCGSVNTDSLLPGDCIGSTGAALTACLSTKLACRTCQTVNAFDDISADCDTFDDGVNNDSCSNDLCGTGAAALSGCFFEGVDNESCADVCASVGLSFDTEASVHANDNGDTCKVVYEALGHTTDNGSTESLCTAGEGGPLGCHRFSTDPDPIQVRTCQNDSATTADAASATKSRTCACR